VARRWIADRLGPDESDLPDEDNSRVQMPSRRISPARQILIRIGIAIGIVIVTAIVVYAERGCYADRGNVGTLTPIDALYYSTVTLSTTGYGDIAPVCESARLVNVLVITPLRFLFLIVLIGTTVEYLTRTTSLNIRRRKWRRHVHDHTVIIGFGVKGRSAAQMLLDNGMDESQIVVVTPDHIGSGDAKRMGLVAITGDGRRDDVLEEAGVPLAKQVIVATNEDDTSVLVTLNVRRLAPHADIVASVREANNSSILRQSGADNVIPTAESAGRLMALSLVSPEAGELMEDLLDSKRGLEIVQRAITKQELGLSPHELNSKGEVVLAVMRGDQVKRLDMTSIRVLEKNDQLLVIRDSPTRTDIEE